MELHRFKTILLEFLSDITNIPKGSEYWFLDKEDAKERFDAPNGYKVFSPYVLVKVTTSTRMPERPNTTPSEGDDFCVEEDLKEEIFHCLVDFKIFTEAHVFHISATWKDYHAHYLGCTVTTRKTRVGESWFRGSDLPDGYFCKETWQSIKNRIIKHEMKALSKYIEHGKWQKHPDLVDDDEYTPDKGGQKRIIEKKGKRIQELSRKHRKPDTEPETPQ